MLALLFNAFERRATARHLVLRRIGIENDAIRGCLSCQQSHVCVLEKCSLSFRNPNGRH